jgi:hypothetical protein
VFGKDSYPAHEESANLKQGSSGSQRLKAGEELRPQEISGDWAGVDRQDHIGTLLGAHSSMRRYFSAPKIGQDTSPELDM